MVTLGKYEILEEIGRGGFAVVYKARDTTLDRFVALKVLHPQLTVDPKFVQRFQQEARTAAGFQHPHIVTIHAVGEEAGQHYLAMALLPGRTLDRQLAGGRLPVERAVSIVEQIGRALDAIHEKGLVHRDVKPGNVMVDESGQATLLDFGIVRAAEGTRLTTTMAVLGTPEYMSPELAEGEEPDARSDIYSLGVVAYQMLTGQAPFSAPSPLAVLRFQADKAPPSPRALSPGLSVEVEQVLLKALAKRREERYQSAGELAMALREAAEAGAKTPLLEPRPAVREPRRRPGLGPAKPIPWRWIAAAGLLVSAVIVIGFVLAGGEGEKGESALQGVGRTMTREQDGAVMVDVPGGTFQMGSSEAEIDAAFERCEQDLRNEDCRRELYEEESPQHTVTLDAFWIDKYEVTNAQYRQCVEDGACDAPTTCDWGEPTYDDESKAGHPVICVDWSKAAAYCEWAGGRLPSEAEWEYAARGPQGNIYPWGDDAPTCELAGSGDCIGGTEPVGSFPDGASWCGALDMAGSVWEWVNDWYGEYPSAAQTNPTGPERGFNRGLRGGAWYDEPFYMRSAHRGANSPVSSYPGYGLRCVGASTSSP
jgi:formylglycine-generating enzyme required for sulfatase activity